MRTTLRITLAIAVLLALTNVTDTLKTLGISDATAKENAIAALGNGWLPYGEANHVFKSANATTRIAIVNAALQWVKSYTASPEFAADYSRLRKESKPAAATVSGSAADDVKKQREEQELQIEEMKKSIASLPPEQRKAAEEGINRAIESMKQMQNDAALQESLLKAAASKREEDKLDDEATLLEWETRYPDNPRTLIIRRIKQFLSTSSSVDFDAKLIEGGGRKRFVNPDYEAKPAEWKFCYRAGRESLAAARQFATAWLKELESH
jgi:hypothetical protein